LVWKIGGRSEHDGVMTRSSPGENQHNACSSKPLSSTANSLHSCLRTRHKQ
jgi:hypothetical protein